MTAVGSSRGHRWIGTRSMGVFRMGRTPHDPRVVRRGRLEDAAADHCELPDDVRESQVARAEQALALFGDEDELLGMAVDAVHRNLRRVERAMQEDGASLSRRRRPRP